MSSNSFSFTELNVPDKVQEGDRFEFTYTAINNTGESGENHAVQFYVNNSFYTAEFGPQPDGQPHTSDGAVIGRLVEPLQGHNSLVLRLEEENGLDSIQKSIPVEIQRSPNIQIVDREWIHKPTTVGEEGEIRVYAENKGDASGTKIYSLDFGDLDRYDYAQKSLAWDLQPGERDHVDSVFKPIEPGSYTIGIPNIGDLSYSVESEGQPNLVVSNVEFPQQIEQGKTISIDVTVKNKGRIEGSKLLNVDIRQNGETLRSMERTVSLGGGQQTTETFQTRTTHQDLQNLQGQHTLVVEGQNIGTITVGTQQTKIDIQLQIENTGKETKRAISTILARDIQSPTQIQGLLNAVKGTTTIPNGESTHTIEDIVLEGELPDTLDVFVGIANPDITVEQLTPTSEQLTTSKILPNTTLQTSLELALQIK